MEAHEVASADGNRVYAYLESGGAKGTVVFFNAVGIGRGIFGPIASKLRDRYSIVTWETRGYPSPRLESDEAYALEHHIEDVAAVFGYFGIKRAHAVGWCSGADAAVLFNDREPGPIESLSLINGAYGFAEERLWSRYEQSLTRMFASFLRNPKRKESLHQAVLSMVEWKTEEASVEEEELQELLLDPFRSPERLRAYAKLCLAAKFGRRVDTFGRIAIPTLFLTGDADVVQPHLSTMRAHELTRGSRLEMVSGGDHNGLFSVPQVGEWVDQFIEEVERARAA